MSISNTAWVDGLGQAITDLVVSGDVEAFNNTVIALTNNWNGIVPDAGLGPAIAAKVTQFTDLTALRDSDISAWTQGTVDEVIVDPPGQPEPGDYPIRIQGGGIKWVSSPEKILSEVSGTAEAATAAAEEAINAAAAAQTVVDSATTILAAKDTAVGAASTASDARDIAIAQAVAMTSAMGDFALAKAQLAGFVSLNSYGATPVSAGVSDTATIARGGTTPFPVAGNLKTIRAYGLVEGASRFLVVKRSGTANFEIKAILSVAISLGLADYPVENMPVEAGWEIWVHSGGGDGRISGGASGYRTANAMSNGVTVGSIVTELTTSTGAPRIQYDLEVAETVKARTDDLDARVTTSEESLAGLNAVSIQTGVPTNGPDGNDFTSVTTSGLYSFDAVKTGHSGTATYYVSLATQALQTGDKVSLFYKVTPRDGQSATIGSPRARFFNGATRSNTVVLNRSGGWSVAELTMTGAASTLWIDVLNANADFHFEGFILKGHASDTSYLTTLQQQQLALATMIVKSGFLREGWNARQITPLYSALYGVKGIPLPFYPRQMVDTRSRLLNLDVGIISSSANSYPAVDASPEQIAAARAQPVLISGNQYFEVDPARLAFFGKDFYVHVKNPKDANPGYRYIRKAPWYVAEAVQTGTAKVGWIGTSYGGNVRQYLRNAFEAVGGVYQGVGTLGTGNDKHDTVAGRSLSEVIGRDQRNLVPGSSPYLRDATSTDFTNTPNYCFAKSIGSAANRPSYADDASDPVGYTIFDWELWRVAAGVVATDKIIMFDDHYINDQSGTGYTTERLVADRSFMVSGFRALFINGHYVIALAPPQASLATETGLLNWAVSFCPMYRAMLATFKDRQAEKIHLLSVHAHVAGDVNDIAYDGDLIATDAETGVKTYGMNTSTWVHIKRGNAAQMGWAMAAAACCIHQNIV